MRADPRREHGKTKSWLREERRGRQIERQEDHVPEKVLRGTDFVEGDEGEGLGQKSGREGFLGEENGKQHAGEEELRKKGEGLSGVGGGRRGE